MFDKMAPKIRMKTTTFEVHQKVGYKKNLDLLTELLSQPDEILQTKIHLLVDFFWDSSSNMIMLNSSIYITWSILILLMLIGIIHNWDIDSLFTFNCFYAGVLVIREFIQFNLGFFRYLYKQEIRNTNNLSSSENIQYYFVFPIWYIT